MSENAGSFINSPINDYMNSIPASGDFLLLSRGRSGAEKIYKVSPVPDFLKPARVTLIRVVVIDAKTQMTLPFKIELKDLRSRLVTLQKNYTPLKTGKYNPNIQDKSQIRDYFTRTGLFAPLVVPGNYNLMVTSPGYLFADENIPLKADSKTEETILIELQKIARGSTVALRNLYFITNQAELKKSSQGSLYRVARFLSENETLIVEIQGHTAKDPDAQRALKLSEERARSVADALIQNGIAPERLKTRGFGDTKPVAPNDSAANMAKNRRVEFKILDFARSKRSANN